VLEKEGEEEAQMDEGVVETTFFFQNLLSASILS